MKSLAEIDSNFKVETKITKPDLVFLDVRNEPIEVDGVFYENGSWHRMPEEVAKSVSEGVYTLHTASSGGRIRFKTDSPYIVVNTVMSLVYGASHFAYTGIAGCDVYIRENGNQTYYNTFIPHFDPNKGYEACVTFPSCEMRELVINMPQYGSLQEIYIGLSNTAVLEAPTPYKHEKPIVYYGSSITQGGCASRPGNSYQNMISRRLDTDYLNLGFSGNAKAEDEMIDYVKGLDMSVFVYDYDYNAPSVEHLSSTHEKMFKAVRDAHPDLPVIILSRPKFTFWTEDEIKRVEIIRKTYENALASGDKNVYFLSGKELMIYAGNDGLVDNCHPNDLGFYSMARVLGDMLEKILK